MGPSIKGVTAYQMVLAVVALSSGPSEGSKLPLQDALDRIRRIGKESQQALVQVKPVEQSR